MYRKSSFSALAQKIAHLAGHPAAFCAAVLAVILWAVLGPVFHFSDTWQLAINTSTTILTFLMIFLVQHTQNRDNYAVQLKLDELIRSSKAAHTSLLDIEELTEDELLKLKRHYTELARLARKELREGKSDFDTFESEDSEAGKKARHSRKRSA